MQELDRKLLNMIQDSFPVQPEPYRALAEHLGATEQVVIEALGRLKRDGIIRRMGAIFDSRKLGYVSTLCAMSVPEKLLNEVAQIVNSYPGVTHNYLREHHLNMWFTLIAETQGKVKQILADIESATGIAVMNLPAERFFKVKVRFSLDDGEEVD